MNNEQYKERFAQQLDAKVAAVNKANAEANRLRPLFVEAFRPFVGKKILTNSGLAQKVKDIPEQLAPSKQDGYQTPSVYRNTSNYTLSFTVKTCVDTSNGSGCAYHEATFYVGELDGYDLKSIIEPNGQLKTDHSAAEVRQLRADLDAAEKAYRAAQSALGPFGRYDQ